MKKFLTIALAAALALCCSSAFAGQVWTDGNGDGLPDGGPFVVAPNTSVTVGVWVDAQSFSWTNFLVYVEYNRNCATFQNATYVISGGSNFPIDNFSNPNAIGFSGQGYAQGGVDHIGNVGFQINSPVACCITPIIDLYNPYYTFCQLGTQSGYQLFTTSSETCYGDLQPPTGACCFLDGTCAILTAADCATGGGVYAGDDVSCAAANCPQPELTGACCFADGSCTVETAANCAAAGGTYDGDGVTCAAADCPQPPVAEACCFPATGACADLFAADCVAQGGVPQGAGTACAGTVCPQPTVACCFVDGSCADLVAADCAAQGGSSGAPGSSCATTVCPPPPTRGACCVPGAICIDGALLSECDAAGGIWYPNVLCSANPCDGNAVESKSWGEIKGLYR